MNELYTKLWTDNFDEKKCYAYDSKFKKRFEKNIKHLQQVDIIQPYIKENTHWLDFPIGSARLMNEILNGIRYGYDISEEFIIYSQSLGIKCKKQDLFNPDLTNKFDIITSMHTLFAFSIGDQKRIIKNYSKLLNKNGVLIIDLVNKNWREKVSDYKDGIVPDDNGFYKNEIKYIFKNLNLDVLDIIPHDSIDNVKFINKLFKFRIYGILNKLYFSLNLFPVFNKLSKMVGDKYHSKYIVIAMK